MIILSRQTFDRIMAAVARAEALPPARKNGVGFDGLTPTVRQSCHRTSPITLGSTTELDGSTDADTWARADGVPVDRWYVEAIAYDHEGDKVLRAYMRKESLDACGYPYAISAVTEVEIDAAEPCDQGASAAEFFSY